MSETANAATRLSVERLLAVEPLLAQCRPLSQFRPRAGRRLLHAGPPFAGLASVPVPVMQSAIAAALFEGWETHEADARAAITAGAILLEPAQDHGVVTPLAFVVSPSMWMLAVEDGAGRATPRFAPINDGPLPAALRFGAATDGRLDRLRLLAEIGPALAQALTTPIPVLPILQAGLRGGDDLHGRVAAANDALAALLLPRLGGAAAAYLESAGQFVLNVVMAACALLIGAGEGIAHSRMVTAAGGNGVRFGWRTAGDPWRWVSGPATVPIGPRFGSPDAHALPAALPAIGDSAVIDACGFGAACLRFSPEMMTALEGYAAPEHRDERAHAPFLMAHPGLDPTIRLGLDLDRKRTILGVLLAAIDEGGKAGLVGRGIAPWPDESPRLP